jgi:hypothetical protein
VQLSVERLIPFSPNFLPSDHLLYEVTSTQTEPRFVGVYTNCYFAILMKFIFRKRSSTSVQAIENCQQPKQTIENGSPTFERDIKTIAG